MTLSNFYLNHDFVDLYFTDSTSLRVFFNEYTGTIYQRPKIHPFLKYMINHKGLYIGRLANGTDIIVHNHINPGRAIIATWTAFAENEVVTPDNKSCSNSWDNMVAIALRKVIDREQYHLINFSCQSLVNMSCSNERKNDDTLKVIAGVGLAVLAGYAIKGIVEAIND